MAPKTASTLAGMLDSDGSDVDMADALDENIAPPQKKPAAARKPRKTKPASKRLSGSKKKTAANTARRAPLTERSNEQLLADETEEVDEFAEDQHQPEIAHEEQQMDEDEGEEKPVARKRGRPPTKKPARNATTKAQVQNQEAAEHISPNPNNRPPGSRITSAAGKRGKKPAPHPPAALAVDEESDNIIAESQTAPMDVDESELQDDQVPQSSYRQSNNVRAGSVQTRHAIGRPSHRRTGSNSDTERAGDPALRRKLGDMTKKMETLQTRYNKLYDVGIKEADANFERLKAQSQAQEKAAADLIASLKAELVAARKDAGQNTSLTAQISKAKELARAGDERLKASETQLVALTEKLNVAQSENKSLQAKLAATRQASHDVSASSRLPGSAVKGKNLVQDRAAAAQAAIAQLKEDLYSDLTGLILRGVEKTLEADIYDCIQTGRNGTLHFQLSVDTADTNATYEDTELQYTPRLDQNRDRDLLEILPDYLTEEITFSRANAAKFYSRINDTLTRKLE